MHPALAAARAVIFDFDGVLADSEPLHLHAIAQVAAKRGWSVTHEQFMRMIGKGDGHAFELIAADRGESITADQVKLMVAHKVRICMEGIEAGMFSPQPGAAELVVAISARKPAAVCSGSRRDFVSAMLAKMELLPHFRTVVGLEDVTRSKPDPEPYLLAASKLGVPARECAVIEDSPTGIQSARAAGMTVIGVCHTFPAERLSEANFVTGQIGDLLRRG